ncbi:hypothetical protein DFS34DRAFT_663868, partial [Phlyctochytrium arcticum]
LDGVYLYYEAGRSESGLPLWRCIRGTNAIEGYHKQKLVLVSRTVKSPQMAQYALLDINHRWNIKRAIQNRGLPQVVRGHYAQSLCDEIQHIVSMSSETSPFPTWPIVYMYHDTGEREGLTAFSQSSNFADGRSNEQARSLAEIYRQSLAEETLEDVMTPALSEAGEVPLPHLTHSARFFALELLGSAASVYPIETEEEKRKFECEYLRWMTPADPTSMVGEKQKLSFSTWVSHWNASLGPNIRRKTERHLEVYLKKWNMVINTREAITSIRESDRELLHDLRQAPEQSSISSIPPTPAPPPSRGIQPSTSTITPLDDDYAGYGSDSDLLDIDAALNIDHSTTNTAMMDVADPHQGDQPSSIPLNTLYSVPPFPQQPSSTTPLNLASLTFPFLSNRIYTPFIPTTNKHVQMPAHPPQLFPHQPTINNAHKLGHFNVPFSLQSSLHHHSPNNQRTRTNASSPTTTEYRNLNYLTPLQGNVLLPSLPLPPRPNSGPASRPQNCPACGHIKFAFPEFHQGQHHRCTMSDQSPTLARQHCNCNKPDNHRMKGQAHFHPVRCNCNRCSSF